MDAAHLTFRPTIAQRCQATTATLSDNVRLGQRRAEYDLLKSTGCRKQRTEEATPAHQDDNDLPASLNDILNIYIYIYPLGHVLE